MRGWGDMVDRLPAHVDGRWMLWAGLIALSFLLMLAVILIWMQSEVISFQSETIQDLRRYTQQLEDRLSLLQFIREHDTGLGTKEEKELAKTIYQESRRRNLDWRLIVSIIKVESGFDPNARSKEGAVGLMQLMPSAAQEAATDLGVSYEGFQDLYDFRRNIRLGITYLSALQQRFGNLEKAIRAYNIGPSRTASGSGGIEGPSERYLSTVLAHYASLVADRREAAE